MSRRVTEDIARVAALPNVASCKRNPEDDTVTLAFDGGATYLLTVTDDYPRGTTFFYCEQSQASGGVDGDLVSVCAQLTARFGAPLRGGGCGERQRTQDTVSNLTPHAPCGHDEFDGELPPIDATLLRDMELAKASGFPVDVERVAIGVRITCRVGLADLVSASTAAAWGLSLLVPVDIQLRLERPEYTRSERCPDVFVTQAGKPCRFGQQLRNILDTYLRDSWTMRGWVPPTAGGCARRDDDDVAVAVASRAAHTANVTGLSPAQRGVFDQLIQMGFNNRIAAVAAGEATSVEQAVGLCTDAPPQRAPARRPVDAQIALGPPPPPQPPRPPVDSNNWFKSLQQAGTAATAGCGADANKECAFDAQREGFLVHVARYLRKRTVTAHLYCVICDKTHLVGAGMLKPSVCERDICVHRFQQLNMGKDAADTVATGGGVIDLLVAMFRMAVESNRAEFVLNPYPCVADADGRLVIDPKQRDLAALRALAKALPETKEMLGVESIDQLSAKLMGRNPILMPLLSWIISSNRSMIVKLRADQRLSQIGTPHQFLLVMASPEKQAKFDELKRARGSSFAFHGSRLENWYSIIRVGLKNMSGTAGMVNGAACGAGVYFAQQAATSIGYTGGLQGGGAGAGKSSSPTGRDYFDGTAAGHFACMALCELINGCWKDHGSCWTSTEEDSIITRFFFVFTSQEQLTKTQGAVTSDAAFVNDLRALVDST